MTGTHDDGQTLVGRTPLTRIDVSGGDRQRYLEDVTTQHVVDQPIGAVLGALSLDPHGLPLAMFDIAVLGDRLVILAPDPHVADEIVVSLGSRTFLLDARFERRHDTALAVRGPGAPQMLADAGLGFVEGRCRLAADVLIVARSTGADIIGPTSVIDAVAADLVTAGARQADESQLEDERIAAGIPAWGREVTSPHLPEEAGVLPTHVHLAKGCYPGQETVARMWMLGRPRRRLVQAQRADDGQTPTAEPLDLTSRASDGHLALGYAPSGVTVGDDVIADGHRWQVVRLIGSDMPPGHDPKVVRRRDRQAR